MEEICRQMLKFLDLFHVHEVTPHPHIEIVDLDSDSNPMIAKGLSAEGTGQGSSKDKGAALKKSKAAKDEPSGTKAS